MLHGAPNNSSECTSEMAASDPETKLKRDYNADLSQQTCSVNDLKSYVTRIHLEAGYHVVVLHAPDATLYLLTMPSNSQVGTSPSSQTSEATLFV